MGATYDEAWRALREAMRGNIIRQGCVGSADADEEALDVLTDLRGDGWDIVPKTGERP